MHTDFSPPGPLWQTLNALLHREPLASVFYGLFWSLGLLFATPLAVAALQIFVLFNLFYWFIGTSRRIQYHPKQQQQSKQLAVVITGCDSGFGKELALVAEQAGYVVFAGCLSQESFVHFAHTSVQPLLMDVTSEKHVRQAVQAVENWKANAAADERVLHCLVCNAGIGVLAPIDLMDISDIRKIMEGKLVKRNIVSPSQNSSPPLSLRCSQLLWDGTMLQSFLTYFKEAVYRWFAHGISHFECRKYGGQGDRLWASYR